MTILRTQSHRLYVVLHTRTPCCDRHARFRATLSVPRETYSRVCRACGRHWEVERRTARETDTRRADILEWSPKA